MRALLRVGVLALAAQGSAANRARADAALYLPGDDARRLAEEAELGARITRQLTALPGVRDADVMVRLPRPAEVALDLPLPAPQLRVVIHEGAHAPDARAIAEVVRAAGLGEGTALVLTRASQGDGDLQRGSERLENTPATHARARFDRVGLLASLLANVILATVLLWRMPHRPRRRTERSKVS